MTSAVLSAPTWCTQIKCKILKLKKNSSIYWESSPIFHLFWIYDNIFSEHVLFCNDARKSILYFLFVALLATNSITRFHSALRLGNHTPETFLLLLWLVSHCFSTRVRQSNFTVIRRVIKRIYQYVLQDLESNSWITVCCQHGHLSFSRGLCDAAVTLEVAGLRWEVLNEVTLCAHLTTHTRWLHKENVILALSTAQPQHQVVSSHLPWRGTM